MMTMQWMGECRETGTARRNEEDGLMHWDGTDTVTSGWGVVGVREMERRHFTGRLNGVFRGLLFFFCPLFGHCILLCGFRTFRRISDGGEETCRFVLCSCLPVSLSHSICVTGEG